LGSTVPPPPSAVDAGVRVGVGVVVEEQAMSTTNDAPSPKMFRMKGRKSENPAGR
jgi:hypothetical protein